MTCSFDMKTWNFERPLVRFIYITKIWITHMYSAMYYLLGYLLMIISINIGIQSMVNVWELMMAMVEQFGV